MTQSVVLYAPTHALDTVYNQNESCVEARVHFVFTTFVLGVLGQVDVSG